jgi:hypothetical protein
MVARCWRCRHMSRTVSSDQLAHSLLTSPDAADRLERALSLVESEFKLSQQSADRRMLMSIGASYIRTDR